MHPKTPAMTAFRISRRTHEFSSTLFFVIVSAVPAEGNYSAEDILLRTGNAFSREAAMEMEKRFEEQLLGELRARGDSITA
jgi:hypothetical protein